MKTYIKIFSTLFIGATVLFSCQQAEEPQLDAVQPEAKMTRAFGDKTPIVAIYVETNVTIRNKPPCINPKSFEVLRVLSCNKKGSIVLFAPGEYRHEDSPAQSRAI